jgi:hypothetical protein
MFYTLNFLIFEQKESISTNKECHTFTGDYENTKPFPFIKMSPYVKRHWKTFRAEREPTDTAFALIRIIVLWGVVGWLIFSPVSRETVGYVSSLVIFFLIYSIFVYLFLFFFPERKRAIYQFFLFFDFLFTTLLVKATGGFESPFSSGFYLMTALYSFYFGAIAGTIIATSAAVLYLASGNFDFTKMYWTDVSVRITFLFVLALPLGMLSQKLKKDKDKIEVLKMELERHIENVKKTQKEP